MRSSPPRLRQLDACGERRRARRRRQGASRRRTESRTESAQSAVAADMRYKGQAFELTVAMRGTGLDAAALERLIAGFHALHRQRFSYANVGAPVEIVSLRATADRPSAPPDRRLRPPPVTASAPSGRRRCLAQRQLAARCRLAPRRHRHDAGSPGPALVIEEVYTTILIAVGWTCRAAPMAISSRRRSHDASKPGSDDDGATPLGPIELEILHNAFIAAAAEMDVTVWRTSRSTIVRELLDYSTAMFDRDGWNVAQSARIPGHLNSMSSFLREILVRSSSPLERVAARRHRHLQRSLYAAASICRTSRFQGRVPRRAADRLRRHALPPPRYRRHLRWKLRLQRDRDLSGGPAHSAREDRRARAPQRGGAAMILQKCASPRSCGVTCSRSSRLWRSARANIERLAAKLGATRYERALAQILNTPRPQYGR